LPNRRTGNRTGTGAVTVAIRHPLLTLRSRYAASGACDERLYHTGACGGFQVSEGSRRAVWTRRTIARESSSCAARGGFESCVNGRSSRPTKPTGMPTNGVARRSRGHSFVPQRDHRIDARRTARGPDRRGSRDEHEQDGDERKSDRIRRRRPHQGPLEQTAGRNRAAQSNDEPDGEPRGARPARALASRRQRFCVIVAVKTSSIARPVRQPGNRSS